MRKVLFVLFNLFTITVMAQVKGRFEVHAFDHFKLHVYYTNDVMADASYIIEGGNAVVTMEQPLFKDNAAEFDAYLSELGKPVERRVTDYHVGGTGSHAVVMAEGMPAFTKGEVSEVAFGTVQTWAGVAFDFRRGASSDFPGASILIGGKVYYTHWVPMKVHVSHLQISSPAAIDAEIAEAKESLSSGAELFIGGHGGAAGRDAVAFKVAYLGAMKKALQENASADGFVEAMKKAYPGLPGEDGLADVAAALYARR